MASNIIKQVKVTATFPNGRVVNGFTNAIGGRLDEPFQVWLHIGSAKSVIINTKFAETVELEIEYEK